MAVVSEEDDDLVVLVLTTDPSDSPSDEISVSAMEIERWDLPLLFRSRVIRIQAVNRTMLVHHSSYFRSILRGGFSESSLTQLSIQWSPEIFIDVLQFIYGRSVNITLTNFLLLLEGALFFGVDALLLECTSWFHKITSPTGQHSLSIPVHAIIEIWNFALDHGIGFITEQCSSYVARNFVGLLCIFLFFSSDSIQSIVFLHRTPSANCQQVGSVSEVSILIDNMLMLIVVVMVYSEKQLHEALLIWLTRKKELTLDSSNDPERDYFKIFRKADIFFNDCFFSCLPDSDSPFAFGICWKRRNKYTCDIADKSVSAIIDLMNNYSSLLCAETEGKLDNFQIRLTQYSEKIELQGCVQLKVPLLFTAAIPPNLDFLSKKRIIQALIDLDHHRGNYSSISQAFSLISFDGVYYVDVSKCPKLHFGAAMKFLNATFPCLRVLKFTHCTNFKIEQLFDLIETFPLIKEVDFTVDISPVIPSQVSVSSASTEEYEVPGGSPYVPLKKVFSLSNIRKLTLEGRTDISDLDLLNVSILTKSLAYINLKGCTLLTDAGLAKLVTECVNLNSMVVSYTSFGRNSILAVCSAHLLMEDKIQHNHENSKSLAFRLQELHIDGCKGEKYCTLKVSNVQELQKFLYGESIMSINDTSMKQLTSQVCMLKSLSLRDTHLSDDALYKFTGVSLENLDVSETMVSMVALSSIIGRNTGLKSLKMTGCRNLHFHGNTSSKHISGAHYDDLYHKLGEKVLLEEVALGWGFFVFSLEILEPAIREVRAITVGTGASLSHQALFALPNVCPLLEIVILNFQVISDTVLRGILGSLRYLQVLGLCCCLGDLTSQSFNISMPSIRTLRLEWITPWMTNEDLAILAQNSPNLVELSLSGCKLLNPDAQFIISSGWPGLTYLHLEDCGDVMSSGASSIFECKALEDLLLRHAGQGIGKNFVVDAALRLPLLRKIALDLCDACEGGFDTPDHGNRFFLSTITIACCKRQRCSFNFQRAAHKQTIVVEWNSKETRTTIVKERV